MLLMLTLVVGTIVDSVALRQATTSSADCSARCSRAYATLLQPKNPNPIAFYWGASMIMTLLAGVNPNVTNPFRLVQHKLEQHCEWFKRYEVCLSLCHKSSVNKLYLAGIAVPLHLCKNEVQKLLPVLPCLFASRNRLSWACRQTECWVHTALFWTDESAKTQLLCRALTEHDLCFNIAAYRSCGSRVGSLMKQLQDVSKETVSRLSRMPELSGSLPNSCLLGGTSSIRDSNVEFLRTSCAVSGCVIAQLSAVLFFLSFFYGRLC